MQKACEVATERIRRECSESMSKLEYTASLRRLNTVYYTCGSWAAGSPATLLLFPYGGNKDFFRRSRFRVLKDILDMPMEIIEPALAREGIAVSVAFKLFYEAYHELVDEYSRVVTLAINTNP